MITADLERKIQALWVRFFHKTLGITLLGTYCQHRGQGQNKASQKAMRKWMSTLKRRKMVWLRVNIIKQAKTILQGTVHWSRGGGRPVVRNFTAPSARQRDRWLCKHVSSCIRFMLRYHKNECLPSTRSFSLPQCMTFKHYCRAVFIDEHEEGVGLQKQQPLL